MTIQHYSSINKSTTSSPLITSLLNKPINKSKKPPTSFRLPKSQQILDLLIKTTTKSTPTIPIPIKSAHHTLNYHWSNTNGQTSFSPDKKSVLFHPDCTSCFETDAVHANIPLKSNGYTYWEVTVLKNGNHLNGTSVQIGVGNLKARTNSIGYINLLGIDANSYGLSHNGDVWHGNKSRKFCEPWDIDGSSSNITIGCLFNGFTGQLSYYRNGRFLGVGLDRIDMGEKSEWYPMVSSTVGQSGFRLEMACESFPSLMELCGKKVMSCKGMIRDVCQDRFWNF